MEDDTPECDPVSGLRQLATGGAAVPRSAVKGRKSRERAATEVLEGYPE